MSSTRGGRAPTVGTRAAVAKTQAKAKSNESKKRKSQWTDEVNGNTPFFKKESTVTTDALRRWKDAQPIEDACGVLSMSELEEKTTSEAIAEERKQIETLVPMKPDTRTLNGDLSFSTTQCKRIDLFFAMVRGASRERVQDLSSKAWMESAENTVQLMLHARDARGGKGERLISLYSMLWLRTNKPATYMHNLLTFLSVGYFKDLLQLAVLVKELGLPPMGAGEREDIQRKVDRAEEQAKKKVKVADGSASSSPAKEIEHEVLELELLAEFLKNDLAALEAHKVKVASIEARRAARREKTRQEIAEAMRDVDEWKDSSCSSSEAEAGEILEGEWEAVPASSSTPATTYAATMAVAMETEEQVTTLEEKESKSSFRVPHLQLSLASKWAPTEGSAFDKKHRLAKRLARLLYPNNPQCFRLYREFLSEARTHLSIVEKMMCTKSFDAIDFEKIPAKAHQLLKKALGKHCGDRYQNYLGDLQSGRAKINTAGILPHELASAYITGLQQTEDGTIEGAWTTLLAKLKAKCSANGGLGNAISIIDVSGSMMCNNCIPMNVGISLGLLVSELASGPFKGRCITFSESPQWFQIPQHTSLLNQVRAMKSMKWGMSTNLMAVFTMILKTATTARVAQEDMPGTLFLFSDMQFNQAIQGGDSFMEGSSYQQIKSMYHRAGYEVPSIVFWNLNGNNHTDFPVDITTPGVALIGGYSAELLKSFLAGYDINPMTIMLESIKGYKAVIEESER